MIKKFLILRAGKFYFAVPPECLLELVDLHEYEKDNDKRENTAYRIWRGHVLEVIHLQKYIDPSCEIEPCKQSIVFKSLHQENPFFLDISENFSFLNIVDGNLKKMKYMPEQLKALSIEVCEFELKNAFAFVLSENSRFVTQGVDENQ